MFCRCLRVLIVAKRVHPLHALKKVLSSVALSRPVTARGRSCSTAIHSSYTTHSDSTCALETLIPDASDWCPLAQASPRGYAIIPHVRGPSVAYYSVLYNKPRDVRTADDGRKTALLCLSRGYCHHNIQENTKGMNQLGATYKKQAPSERRRPPLFAGVHGLFSRGINMIGRIDNPEDARGRQIILNRGRRSANRHVCTNKAAAQRGTGVRWDVTHHV